MIDLYKDARKIQVSGFRVEGSRVRMFGSRFRDSGLRILESRFGSCADTAHFEAIGLALDPLAW